MFDDANGWFFQQVGTVYSVVRRSSISGLVVDSTIPQANWSIDRFDGAGKSGMVIDFTKVQTFVIDIDGMRSRRTRLGFVLNGRMHYCHEFEHTNQESTAYMQVTPLPCRFEIQTTATTTQTATMKQLGVLVYADGASADLLPRTFSTPSARTPHSSAYYPVMSIRLKAAGNRRSLAVNSVELLNTANVHCQYRIFHNPTLTGASWVTGSDVAEIDHAATSMSGGTALHGGLISLKTQIMRVDLPHILPISRNVDGMSDILTIGCRTVTGSASTYAVMNWGE